MKNNIFLSDPLYVIDGIPVFSNRDDYIKNYELISEDHLRAISLNGTSPFMSAEQIQASHVETLKLVKKNLAPGKKILEAGVGLGDLLACLDGYDRYGVDISLPYLSVVKNKGINVAMAKLEELPYADETFDAIIACDVLEHVFRLELSLENMLRVLKPEGLLIVRVPNEEQLTSYLDGAQKYAHSHVRKFCLPSLRLLFEKCFGMEFVEHQYIGHVFNSFYQIKNPPTGLKSEFRTNFVSYLAAHPEYADIQEVKIIAKLLDSSLEELVDALIDVRNKHNEFYAAVCSSIIEPVEIAVAFRKK